MSKKKARELDAYPPQSTEKIATVIQGREKEKRWSGFVTIKYVVLSNLTPSPRTSLNLPFGFLLVF